MKEIVLKTVTFLVLFCVITPLLLLWQGWSISTLWNWFVAPLGAPEIGIVTATGLALVVGALRMRKSKNRDETNADRYEAIASLVIVPPAAVFMGWIIKTFA